MNRTNTVCVNCMCNVCKCGAHAMVSYSYKGRIPSQSSSKKEWIQFIELFLSYDPIIKKQALQTIENYD